MADKKPPVREAAPPPLRICPGCQATGPAKARSCWLCGRPLDKTDKDAAASEPARSAPWKLPAASERRAASQNGLALLLSGVAIFAVLFGIYRFWPVVAIILGLIVVPAFLAVTLSTQSQRIATVPGNPFAATATPAETTGAIALSGCVVAFATAAVSMVAGAAIVIILIIAALASLFSICTGNV